MNLSVVTPTLGRPEEVRGLLEYLRRQTVLPAELILVDGAGDGDERTREVAEMHGASLPFELHYVRQGGGTAIQRNAGIDRATGDFVGLIDDDIRPEPDFFARIAEAFEEDEERRIGGITGYVVNQYLDPTQSRRWRWYRRLKLFTTYEPGRYDFDTGYPINRYLRPPHEEIVEVDFMGAGCAVWRREIFDEGLRFSCFFTGYGVLEDAHLALRAGRRWTLLEHGGAHCRHLRSPHSRVEPRDIARMSAVNYRFVFVDIVPQRSARQEWRFWRVQCIDLLRFAAVFLRNPGRRTWGLVAGKLEGMFRALRLPSPKPSTEETS